MTTADYIGLGLSIASLGTTITLAVILLLMKRNTSQSDQRLGRIEHDVEQNEQEIKRVGERAHKRIDCEVKDLTDKITKNNDARRDEIQELGKDLKECFTQQTNRIVDSFTGLAKEVAGLNAEAARVKDVPSKADCRAIQKQYSDHLVELKKDLPTLVKTAIAEAKSNG